MSSKFRACLLSRAFAGSRFGYPCLFQGPNCGGSTTHSRPIQFKFVLDLDMKCQLVVVDMGSTLRTTSMNRSQLFLGAHHLDMISPNLYWTAPQTNV